MTEQQWCSMICDRCAGAHVTYSCSDLIETVNVINSYEGNPGYVSQDQLDRRFKNRLMEIESLKSMIASIITKESLSIQKEPLPITNEETVRVVTLRSGKQLQNNVTPETSSQPMHKKEHVLIEKEDMELDRSTDVHERDAPLV